MNEIWGLDFFPQPVGPPCGGGMNMVFLLSSQLEAAYGPLPFPKDAVTQTSQIRCKLWRGTDSPSALVERVFPCSPSPAPPGRETPCKARAKMLAMDLTSPLLRNNYSYHNNTPISYPKSAPPSPPRHCKAPRTLETRHSLGQGDR